MASPTLSPAELIAPTFSTGAACYKVSVAQIEELAGSVGWGARGYCSAAVATGILLWLPDFQLPDLQSKQKSGLRQLRAFYAYTS